jgi:hypothetical protein
MAAVNDAYDPANYTEVWRDGDTLTLNGCPASLAGVCLSTTHDYRIYDFYAGSYQEGGSVFSSSVSVPQGSQAAKDMEHLRSIHNAMEEGRVVKVDCPVEDVRRGANGCEILELIAD